MDDIRLKLGWLYRVVHECLNKPEGPWKEKARRICGQVLASQNATAREEARVALYNLEHERRVYAGANEW